VPLADNPPLTTDPRSPDYDVIKLTRSAKLSLVRAFETEPRDPVFAPAREQMLRETVEADLTSVYARARLASVECRSATCKLVFAGKTMEEARWGSLILRYTAPANAVQPGSPLQENDEFIVSTYVAYDAENRAHAVWAQTYARQREANLARWRARPVPDGFPPVPPN
jgi:hypothetical protein